MSKPKPSTLTILFIVVVAALGPQVSEQAHGQQWKIAFESRRDGDMDIYLVNPDGSDLQRLTTGAEAWEPTWSPDRSKILVASTLHGGGEGEEEVYVMDADGTNMRRLTHTPGEGTSSWSADWSPDGEQIVFTSNRDGGDLGWDGYELYVMAADGSNVRRLTRRLGSEGVPAWSPDGTKIAFTRHPDGDQEGRGDIYVIQPDGTNLQRLTRDARASRPSWSPDGKKIAFMSDRSNRKQADDADEIEIYVMDADGANIQRLTHRPGPDGHPDWSPDGSEIVFAFYGEGNTGTGDDVGIYVIGADGTNLRQLTFGGRNEGHPNW